MLQSAASTSSAMQVGTLPHLLYWGEALLPIGLFVIWIKVIIFSLGHGLLFSNFQWFSVKAAVSHHPVIQKELQELLSKGVIEHQLVILVSIPRCLSFLSVCVVYSLFSVLSDLITTCTYPLSRCIVLNRYCNLFSEVIILSPLILRMLYYILFSILVTFCDLFGKINLIRRKVCHLGLLQPLRFSLLLLNLYCSFLDARIFILLFI